MCQDKGVYIREGDVGPFLFYLNNILIKRPPMQPQNPCIEREEIDLMKKLIGLIPLYDDDKDSYWMLPGYMKVLEACGAIPGHASVNHGSGRTE